MELQNKFEELRGKVTSIKERGNDRLTRIYHSTLGSITIARESTRLYDRICEACDKLNIHLDNIQEERSAGVSDTVISNNLLLVHKLISDTNYDFNIDIKNLEAKVAEYNANK